MLFFSLIAAAIACGHGIRRLWKEKQVQDFVHRLTWYDEPFFSFTSNSRSLIWLTSIPPLTSKFSSTISLTRGVKRPLQTWLTFRLSAYQFISLDLIYSTKCVIGYSLASRRTEFHVSATLLVMML